MNYKERNAGTILNHRQPYATPEEVFWLRSAAGLMPQNGQVVILGAGPGIMATALKDGNPSLNILLVDHDTCYYALTHLASFGDDYSSKVAPVISDSAKAGLKYNGPQLDMLIVDADHTEEGVASDILSWLPHMKVGAWVVFHDYDATGTMFESREQYPGVKRAVDRLMTEQRFVDRVGTSALFQVEDRI